MVSMNKLPIERRCQVIAALVEGNSIRSTVRMTGVAKNTVTNLPVSVGRACARYQHEVMKNLPCEHIQVDEIWCFCHSKQKNVPEAHQGEKGYGDVWTFTAIESRTKLVPCWLVGWRDGEHATVFIRDLAGRLANRVQLTTDGHKMYLEAVEAGFGGEIDYAMLIKHYGSDGDRTQPETRYSPGECNGSEKVTVTGNPDPLLVSTSYVERQNLTMRMRMRRFTRLTNAFSKKLENLECAIALHFMHYNFVRCHQTLRMPPALKAGVTDHLWTIEEVVRLADGPENSN